MCYADILILEGIKKITTNSLFLYAICYFPYATMYERLPSNDLIQKIYLDKSKIPLNLVRWRNLYNGVNPPLLKGDLLVEYSDGSNVQ